MNSHSTRYTDFSLCREMLELPDIVRNFNPAVMQTFIDAGSRYSRVLFTGEGSSRLFPAKHAIWRHLQSSKSPQVFTEGATQASEYPLSDCLVVGSSNSGRTKELIGLFSRLKSAGHPALFGITAGRDTPLAEYSQHTRVLACGPEQAVAATKSVIEQALSLDVLLSALRGEQHGAAWFEELSQALQSVLEMAIPPVISKNLAAATRLYFAGRNNGVAEELTLKTNEIIRKPSCYLEGTYAVHGIEEVMDNQEMIVLVDPWEEEEAKFESCLSQGVGMKVIAIANRPTRFPTILLPKTSLDNMSAYLQLAAGWNLLVDTGLELGVALDTPKRARKIGNAI